MLDQYIAIGEISKPQGVLGDLKVRPMTDNLERFYDLEYCYILKDGKYERIMFEVVRIDGSSIYIHIDGLEDRQQADSMRGVTLYVDRENAVELPEDYDFVCDLIGCIGIDDEGGELGKLVDVMQPGGNDVYVFHGKQGEILVPALKSVVIKSDVANKQIIFSKVRLLEVAVFED